MLTLGLVAAVLMLVAGIALLARAQSARGAAQAAADLGVLAAAAHLDGGSSARASSGGAVSGAGVRDPGTACAIAREVVTANGASLTACVLLGGGVVRVTVVRPGGLGPARASARAGPARPDAG
ncbi:MAG TPA: histidine kinase [Cellulomonas sp.]